MSETDRVDEPTSVALRLIVAVAGAIAGALIGGFGGYLFWSLSNEDYAQFGYEFEGLAPVAGGMAIGSLAGVLAALWLFSKRVREARRPGRS